MVNMGIMGGTFDPIHNGHLVVAEEMRNRLELAEVLFVPAGRPYMRAREPLASARDRLEMVRLGITGKPHFRVSSIEVERPGPSYMGETIAELRRQSAAGTGIYLILGWDSIASLPHWKDPARLVEMCRLVAVRRPGFPPPDLNALEAAIPGIKSRVAVMDSPEIDISARDIRERIAKGLPFEHLVPEAVARYIREHRLYKIIVD